MSYRTPGSVARRAARRGATSDAALERELDRAGATARDRYEARTFARYLRLGLGPDEPGELRRRAPGWIPYVLGLGPPPPEGMDAEHPTAWTLPG